MNDSFKFDHQNSINNTNKPVDRLRNWRLLIFRYSLPNNNLKKPIKLSQQYQKGLIFVVVYFFYRMSHPNHFFLLLIGLDEPISMLIHCFSMQSCFAYQMRRDTHRSQTFWFNQTRSAYLVYSSLQIWLYSLIRHLGVFAHIISHMAKYTFSLFFYSITAALVLPYTCSAFVLFCFFFNFIFNRGQNHISKNIKLMSTQQI